MLPCPALEDEAYDIMGRGHARRIEFRATRKGDLIFEYAADDEAPDDLALERDIHDYAAVIWSVLRRCR